MYSRSQLLNGVGLLLEGIGIVWAIKKFPSRQKHEEGEADKIIEVASGVRRHIYYEDLVKDFFFQIMLVGVGLFFEFIATFI